jgi:uncharacterized protein (DUF427 family)
MSTRASDIWMQAIAGGLHEPTDKRVRVAHGGATVADSGRALLVWEPRRVVPSYAVPLEDVVAELVPDAADPPADDGRRALHPGIPFAVHSTPGESLTVRTSTGDRPAAAFRPADPDLDGYVVLDFFSFDEWYEEDDRIVGHPRDPFSRIDVRNSSRHVRVELDGQVLAESSRPMLLFETGLPTRYYLPREDVRLDLMRPSDLRSWCAYKGQASYWSLDLEDRTHEHLVWTYEEPLRGDADAVVGRVAFFNERVDLVVDDAAGERPDSEFFEEGWHEGTAR